MRIESNRPSKSGNGGWIHRLSVAVAVRVSSRGNHTARHALNPVDWPARARRLFEAMKERERAELALSLGVSSEALESLGVGIGADPNGARFSSWPERNPSGHTVGILRRYKNGTKKLMAGGKRGLYLPIRWPEAIGPLLLPEGGTDAAALLTLGLCAIGRPSNIGGINMLLSLLKRHRDLAIVVMGENDRKPERVGIVAQCPQDCPGCSWCWPGMYGARHTAEKLSELSGRRVHWLLPDGAKDVRDWVRLNGLDCKRFLSSLR